MKAEITSVNNPRVKQWVQLLNRKGRERQAKFLIEGIHLVQEALRNESVVVESVAYDLERGIPQELKDTDSRNIEWIGVNKTVLAKCTDTLSPQGVFAIVRKLTWEPHRLFQDAASLVVVIDGVQDPGNLGTIIRSADAVNASGILLGKGTVDLYNPKTVRSTMGSLFHLPIVEGELMQMLPAAREKGIQIVNTSLQAEQHCYDLDLRSATWFIVGNEGAGVSAEVMSYVDQHVKIPMHGQAESLNVAMATTVLLYEAVRQRLYAPTIDSVLHRNG